LPPNAEAYIGPTGMYMYMRAPGKLESRSTYISS